MFVPPTNTTKTRLARLSVAKCAQFERHVIAATERGNIYRQFCDPTLPIGDRPNSGFDRKHVWLWIERSVEDISGGGRGGMMTATNSVNILDGQSDDWMLF